MKSLPRYLTYLFALVAVLTVGIQRASAATPDSEQITKLLHDAKIHAVQAEDDAATLQSYTRSRLSWGSHATELNSMKVHVNEMGKIAADLQKLEAEGSEWQKQAIAQVMPLLKDMADNLNKTILHLNDNQRRIHLTEYKDYTHKNYELARMTAKLISDFIEYDEAKSTAMSLEDKLELAGK